MTNQIRQISNEDLLDKYAKANITYGINTRDAKCDEINKKITILEQELLFRLKHPLYILDDNFIINNFRKKLITKIEENKLNNESIGFNNILDEMINLINNIK